MTCHKNHTSSWRTTLFICAALTQIFLCCPVEAITRQLVKRSGEEECQSGCSQCPTAVKCCPYPNPQDKSCCYSCCSPNQRFIYRRDPCACSPRSCYPYPSQAPCTSCYQPCVSTYYPTCYPSCPPSCCPNQTPCECCPSYPSSSYCPNQTPYDCYPFPNYSPYYNCYSDYTQFPCYPPYNIPYFPGFSCDKPNKKIKLQVIETMEYPQCERQICCQKGPKELCKVVPENCLDQFLEEYDLDEGEYRICPCPKWKIPKYYCVKFYKKPCQCKSKGKQKGGKNEKKEKGSKKSESKDKDKDSGKCC